MSSLRARRWFCASLLVLTAGCSGLRGGGEPDRIYILHAAAPVAGDSVPGVLSVHRPAMQPGLDSDRIALTRGSNELDYFASSRWGEGLPKVLSAMVVETLGGGAGFGTVVSADRVAVLSDRELVLTVRHFEAEYAAGDGKAAPMATVAFDCVITAGTPRRVLGRCDAHSAQPAASNRMSEIVAALERAAQAALADVRKQAVALAQAEPPRR